MLFKIYTLSFATLDSYVICLQKLTNFQTSPLPCFLKGLVAIAEGSRTDLAKFQRKKLKN
jgi:hypothetical protein